MKQGQIEVHEGFYESADYLIAAINNTCESHFELYKSKLVLIIIRILEL